jgi:hypothetical protein
MKLKIITSIVLLLATILTNAQSKLVNIVKITGGLAVPLSDGATFKAAPTLSITDYIQLRKKGSDVVVMAQYAGTFNTKITSSYGVTVTQLRAGFRQFVSEGLYTQTDFGIGF